MPDDINKKISINVQVNTDGQQQITQYKAVFDDLRNSINSIKNPLSGISGDLKLSIK
jgi:nitrogen-specific signal transduction histidine kinase